MIKNAYLYVTRKALKSLIILLVILSMSCVSLVALSIKDSTNKASNETFKNITNSFQLEINRAVNPGTPRGSGNVKGKDIKKISSLSEIDSYIKRIGAVADLDGLDIISVPDESLNRDAEKIKQFKKAVMLTGVNDSQKETKFISKEFKLIQGEHLKNDDKNKVLIHKELAEKNNLKIGDKIKLKSNIYDADNEKGAKETVEVEIKGIFDGKNKTKAIVSQELYQNNIISDIHTASKIYGNTEDSQTYLDATFFVKGDKNIDSVIKNVKKLDINFNEYSLVKSSKNYPALQKSISGIYKLANQLFVGSLVFVGVVITILLLLWINARKKEIAILLSIGKSKFEIFLQFLVEIVFITIPSFVASYFLAGRLGNYIANTVLQKVTTNVTKEFSKAIKSSNLGSGAEAQGFSKTITKLDMTISKTSLMYVMIFISLVLLFSVLVSSYSILRKKPKELLVDID